MPYASSNQKNEGNFCQLYSKSCWKFEMNCGNGRIKMNTRWVFRYSGVMDWAFLMAKLTWLKVGICFSWLNHWYPKNWLQFASIPCFRTLNYHQISNHQLALKKHIRDTHKRIKLQSLVTLHLSPHHLINIPSFKGKCLTCNESLPGSLKSSEAFEIGSLTSRKVSQ